MISLSQLSDFILSRTGNCDKQKLENFVSLRKTELPVTRAAYVLRTAPGTAPLLQIPQHWLSLPFLKYVTVLFLQFISLLPPVTRHKTSVISPLNNCRVVSSFPRLHFQSKFANISLKVNATHLLLSLWLACDLQASFSEQNVIFQALIGNNGLPFCKMFLVLATQNYIGFLDHV